MALLCQILFIVLCSFVFPSQALWPEPVSSKHGTQVLWALPNLDITIARQIQTSSSSNSRNESLYVIAREFLLDIYSQLSYRSYHSAFESWNASEQGILQAAIIRSQEAITSTKFVPWKLYRRN